MTISTEEAIAMERAKPTEVVSRAILDAFEEHGMEMDERALAGGRLYLSGDIDAVLLGKFVLKRLVSHGFLNENYFAAREAEEKAAEIPEKRGVSA